MTIIIIIMIILIIITIMMIMNIIMIITIPGECRGDCGDRVQPQGRDRGREGRDGYHLNTPDRPAEENHKMAITNKHKPNKRGTTTFSQHNNT